MKILGISAFYHDSAAAIVKDGKILAAAQEERFTRIKHDPGFPKHAIEYCLDYAGTSLDQLDAIVFYDKPLLKFERLLETYYRFSPQGFVSFLKAIPVWLKEKLFLKRLIKDELAKIGTFDAQKTKLLFPEHHLSHAASAFYPAPYEEAAILTVDGVGEWATASICHGKGNNISILKELDFPHSIGLLYSAVTYYCGFKVNSGEYKLMGLAPYGHRNAETEDFKKKIKEHLVDIKEDGSIWLNQAYFNYATGLRMTHDHMWEKAFGFKRRESETNLEQVHCNFALAIQDVTEEIVVKMAKEAKRLTGSKNLCMAGGVALNCVANGKLQKEGIFENLYIQPAAGDAGGALGAALVASYVYFNEKRPVDTSALDAMQGSYLGPEYTDQDTDRMVAKYDAQFEKFEKFEDLATKTAKLLAEGNVIGWMQGRMEFGPRALGARSILGDPRNAEMQKKLNLKIKYREGFRPFAPSVLAEDVSDYFDYEGVSPYMLLVHPVHPDRAIAYPDSLKDAPMMEKLYFLRSDLPSITHIDYSARIQTVHKETNPRYYTLIDSFKKETGYGVIVNTSFNVRGEPIVCTPEDSYKCLMRTEMDYLVVGNYLFDKKTQPAWTETQSWKDEYQLD